MRTIILILLMSCLQYYRVYSLDEQIDSGFFDNRVSDTRFKVSGTPEFLITGENENVFSEIGHNKFHVTKSEFVDKLKNEFSNSEFWVRFPVFNSSDTTITTRFHFFESEITQLYLLDEKRRILDSVIAGPWINKRDELAMDYGFGSLKTLIPPNMSLVVYIKIIRYGFINLQDFKIRIYDEKSWIKALFYNGKSSKSYLYPKLVFLGCIFIQFLYTLTQWVQIRRKLYLYYALYLLTILLYVYIPVQTNIAAYWFNISGINGFMLVTMGMDAIVYSSYAAYLAFLRHFLRLQDRSIYVNTILKVTEKIILTFIILYTVLIIVFHKVFWLDAIYFYASCILFIFALILFIYLFRFKDTAARFLLVGSLFMGLGGMATVIIQFTDIGHIGISMEMGIVLEILCFTSGLAFLSRQDEKDKIRAQQLLIDKMEENAKLTGRIQQIRQKIAAELHDDIGSQLSTVKLFLSKIKMDQSKVAGDNIIDNSLGLLDNSIKDLRYIIDDLHPAGLTNKDFIGMTEELVSRIANGTNIKFQLTHHDMRERLDAELEHNLFRITQELINNTLKYAEAQLIIIDIVRINDKITFIYEDDGCGFDMNTIIKGHGIENINSRVNKIGGQLEWSSVPGMGMHIVIECPAIQI